jgi:serine/threonine protein kinase
MMQDHADLEQGERIVGQYVLVQKIGEGGMAEVWKAQHRVLGTFVAIKFLRPGFAGVLDIEKRFLDEGKRQAQLSHPNIVSAYDFLYEDGRSYLIMKLVEGESLEDRLFRLQGPLDLAQVLTISGDVLRALDYAHAQHVIHRDIKPSNILIDHDGRAFVMDFGIALVLGEQRVTRVGVAVGTPHFMSPEQIMGARVLDPRTDIYSYGCVLYEMLTGQLPFDVPEGQGGTDFVIQNMHLNQPPIPPRQLNPLIPPHMERAVLRCLEKKADDRFNTCHDLLTALLSSPPASSGRQTLPNQPVRHGTVIEEQQIDVPRGKTVLEQQVVVPEGQQLAQKNVKQEVRQPEITQPRKQKGSNLVAIIAGALLAVLAIGGGVYWYTHRTPETKEGKVSVQCNVDCDWTLDGKAQDKLSANQPHEVTLSFGDHKISASTTDNKSHKDVSFNVSSSSQTLTESIELPTGPGPKIGPVSVQCNVDCNWALDRQPQGQMSANQPSDLKLPFGPHQVSASTTDGKVSRNVSFRVVSENQILAETIDLKSATPPPPPPPPSLTGTWNGTYNVATPQLTSPVKLILSDKPADFPAELSGTMTFAPGSKFQSICHVSGVYTKDAHGPFMYLQVSDCNGIAPNYLKSKFVFSGVQRTDRQLQGANNQDVFIQLQR